MKHTIKCYATYWGGVLVAFAITTAIVMLLVMTPGCATMPQSDKDTACKNATWGYNLAVIMLDTVLTPEAKVYWEKYRMGAALVLEMSCAGFTSPVPATVK